MLVAGSDSLRRRKRQKSHISLSLISLEDANHVFFFFFFFFFSSYILYSLQPYHHSAAETFVRVIDLFPLSSLVKRSEIEYNEGHITPGGLPLALQAPSLLGKAISLDE